MFELIDGLYSPLPQIIYFFLALFPLVLIHELGHFILAKLNKVRVDEFGIGFPPRLLKLYSDGETDYTLNLLPLGGFVRLAGEEDPTLPGAFASRSRSARAAVLFAGPLANFLFAALALSALAMAMGVLSPLPGPAPLVQIGTVTETGAAYRAGIRVDDIVVAIDGAGLGNLTEDSQGAPPAGAGAESANGESPYLAALIDATNAHADRPMRVTLLRGVQDMGELSDLVGLETEPVPELDLIQSPAAPDARFVRVVSAAEDRDEVAVGDLVLTRGTESSAIILHGPIQLLEKSVQPEWNAELERAAMGVSIGLLTYRRQLTVGDGLAYGPVKTVEIMGAMVVGLGQMISSPSTAEVAGPVGIARLSRQVASQGWEEFLLFMVLLSVNLGIINLLPIPALDGGRLVFIGLEALRGRRMEPAREAVVHLIGFGLVIGLMVVITVYEVGFKR